MAVVLLAWPWLLGWLRDRRPGWFAGTEVSGLASLRRDLAGHDVPGAGIIAGWLALVVTAAVLPAARGLLAAGRTALNFLQRLSGIATCTRDFVAGEPSVTVLDTRKSLPGWRLSAARNWSESFVKASIMMAKAR